MRNPGTNDVPEIIREFVVYLENGLHARPAAQLVEAATQFQAEVTLEKDGNKASAKSIISVLTIEGSSGAVIKVHAVGADAPEAMQAVAALFEGGFHEEPVPGTEI